VRGSSSSHKKVTHRVRLVVLPLTHPLELLKVNHYKAPRDKLICVLNCCKVIFGPKYLSFDRSWFG
jgi:hypothetical protein